MHVYVHASMQAFTTTCTYKCTVSCRPNPTQHTHIFSTFLHHMKIAHFHNHFSRPSEKRGKISCTILNKSCFCFSARPGRPPKRSSLASLPDAMEKLKKSRLDAADYAYSPARLMGRSTSLRLLTSEVHG